MLAPIVGVTPKFYVMPLLPPIADGRECSARGGPACHSIHEYRLPGFSAETRKRRNGAIFIADALSISHDIIVLIDRAADDPIAVSETYFVKYRVSAVVN